MTKRIHEMFMDEEFEELKEKKGKLTWRSFILNLAKVKKRS